MIKGASSASEVVDIFDRALYLMDMVREGKANKKFMGFEYGEFMYVNPDECTENINKSKEDAIERIRDGSLVFGEQHPKRQTFTGTTR